MRSAAAAFLAVDPLGASVAARLWRADQLDRPARGGHDIAEAPAARSTGHSALDAELPGGGWPGAGLIELLLPAPGSGELALLAPALAGRALLWVAPPLLPYAPALVFQGLDAAQITVVRPDQAADAAWAAEQALRTGALGAVLWWPGAEAAGPRAHAAALPTTLRRLHLAALEGRTPLFAMRSCRARAHSSPAPLRLMLVPDAARGLRVDIFKRRGPPLAAPLHLTLPRPGAPAARARRTAALPTAAEPTPAAPALEAACAPVAPPARTHALVRSVPAGFAA